MVFKLPQGTIKLTFGIGGNSFPVIPINNPGWSLSFDLSPSKEDLVFTKADAESLLKLAAGGNNGKFSLNFENHLRLKTNPLKVEKLRVLGKGRKLSPFYTTLRVIDRTYDFQQDWHKRTYNERRAGTTKLIIDESLPPQIQPLQDDIVYRPASLNPATKQPWTAAESLVDVLENIVGVKGTDWELFTNNLGDPPLEDQTIDDQGNVAIAQAAGQLTGSEGFLDLDGRLIITNRIPGFAKKIIDNLDPPLQPGSDFEFIDRRLERPILIKEGYDIEAEVRFDFDERGTSRTDEDRFLDNTTDLPDLKTLIPNPAGGPFFEMAAGNYVRWDQLLNNASPTWFPPSAPGVSIPKLTFAGIQKRWLSPKLENVYVRVKGAKPEVDLPWARRIPKVRQNYRQQFRMNYRWAAGARLIKAERLLVLSQETGTRAKSPVFTVYTVKPSHKGLRDARDKGQDFGWVVDGSIKSTQPLSASSGAAPVTVNILSQSEGVFRIDYRGDLEGLTAQIVPMKVEVLPNSSPLTKLITWDFAELSADHRLSIVLTMVPFINSYDDLRVLDVTPAQAQAALGSGVTIGPCDGPIKKRRIGEALLTARYGWQEGRDDDLKKLFNVKTGTPAFGDADNEKELRALADADAASYYLGLLDHYLGSRTIPLRPDVKPFGEIRKVRHSVNARGFASTTVIAEYGPPPVDGPIALLPRSFQRKIFKLVNETGV